jgi:hypothetical protein
MCYMLYVNSHKCKRQLQRRKGAQKHIDGEGGWSGPCANNELTCTYKAIWGDSGLLTYDWKHVSRYNNVFILLLLYRQAKFVI